MRAARAGPVLRGQRFANEQIIRGPALAAHKGPVQACLQGNDRIFIFGLTSLLIFLCCFLLMITLFFICIC